jgi:putative peptidoglycan lipid II flippase
VKYGLVALAINFVLSVLLAWYLTRIGYAASHAGLALATSVAALANAWLLYRGLRRGHKLTHTRGWGLLMLRMLIANVALVATLLWLQRPVDWWIAATTLEQSMQLCMAIGGGATAYFVTLAVFGLRSSQLRLSAPQ